MDLGQISERISDNLNAEVKYNDDKKEILAFGIESLFLSIIGLLAILLVAFLFKALVPTLIAVVFGGALRKLSGGFHFNTPFKCLAFGAIVYSLLGVAAKGIIGLNLYNSVVALIALFVMLVIVVLLSPVDCESKPIHSKTFRRKLKISSTIFVAVTFIFVLFSNNSLVNTSAVLGIGYQTFTLLPVFNKKKKEG